MGRGAWVSLEGRSCIIYFYSMNGIIIFQWDDSIPSKMKTPKLPQGHSSLFLFNRHPCSLVPLIFGPIFLIFKPCLFAEGVKQCRNPLSFGQGVHDWVFHNFCVEYKLVINALFLFLIINFNPIKPQLVHYNEEYTHQHLIPSE